MGGLVGGEMEIKANLSLSLVEVEAELGTWTPESSYQGVTQLKVQCVFPLVLFSFIGIEIVLKAMVDISIVNKTSQQAIKNSQTGRQVNRPKY